MKYIAVKPNINAQTEISCYPIYELIKNKIDFLNLTNFLNSNQIITIIQQISDSMFITKLKYFRKIANIINTLIIILFEYKT